VTIAQEILSVLTRQLDDVGESVVLDGVAVKCHKDGNTFTLLKSSGYIPKFRSTIFHNEITFIVMRVIEEELFWKMECRRFDEML